MKNWLRDTIEWLRSYPFPWRRVIVKGSILSTGGTLYIGRGITVTIEGDLVMRGKENSVYLEAGPSPCSPFEDFVPRKET